MRIILCLGVIILGGIGCVTTPIKEKRIINLTNRTQVFNQSDRFLENSVVIKSNQDKMIWGGIRIESGNKFSYLINGKPELVGDDISQLFVATNTLHYGYGLQRGDRWSFVYDGKESKDKTYDGLASIRFSNTGSHYAFIGVIGKKVVMVVDGKEGPLLDFALPCVFSENGNNYIYIGKNGDDVSVFYNGIQGQIFTDITTAELSPDGKRFAYGGLLKRGATVVVDGVESEVFQAVGDQIRFSPDGKRVAYVVKKNGLYHVVENGVMGKGYDNISSNLGYYSPDSQTFIYGAQENGLWFIVNNAEEGHKYKIILLSESNYSHDSKTFAYLAINGAHIYLVVDGREIDVYDDVDDVGPLFDSEGRLYFAGIKNKKWDVLVGEKKYQGFDKIGVHNSLVKRWVALSSSNSRYAFAGKRGNKWVCIVDGIYDAPVSSIIIPLVFSPNGKHYAYVAKEKNKATLVIDGKKGDLFEVPLGSLSVKNDGEASLWVINTGGLSYRRNEKRAPDAGEIIKKR